jgi:hypothetical protein
VSICLFWVASVCKKSLLYKSKCGELAQLVFSCSVTRCFGTLAPMNGFAEVLNNTITVLVTDSDLEQCCRMSLVGSKLVPLLRSIVVFRNAKAMVVHLAKALQCSVKSLLCSQPIQRNRLGVIIIIAMPRDGSGARASKRAAAARGETHHLCFVARLRRFPSRLSLQLPHLQTRSAWGVIEYKS